VYPLIRRHLEETGGRPVTPLPFGFEIFSVIAETFRLDDCLGELSQVAAN
jgi:hypothetical protein